MLPAFDHAEIQTERLVLRPWCDDDAPALFELARDPRIGSAAGWPAHTTVDESRAVLHDVLAAPGSYAVTLRDPGPAGEPAGTLVGAVALRGSGASELARTDDEVDLGYWCGVPFWGRGYIPEASRALLAHARDAWGMKVAWCAHYAGNEKSRRAMEKCGFVFDHLRRAQEVSLLGGVRDEVVCRLDLADLGSERLERRLQAIELLRAQKGPERFLPLVEPLRLGRAEVLFLEEDAGVLTRTLVEGTYFCAPFTPEGLQRMAKLIPPGATAFLPGVALAPELHPADGPWPYELWVYDQTVPPAVDVSSSGLSVRPLTLDDREVVGAHYGLIDQDAIAHHLANGWLWGGYGTENTLVGFIGEHTEASMGMLEVFPEARRRGYAAVLQAFQMGHMLDCGRTPFCHVAPDNVASQALQRKLGMRPVGVTQCWMELPGCDARADGKEDC